MNARRWRLQINGPDKPDLHDLPLNKKNIDDLIEFLTPYLKDEYYLVDAEIFSEADLAEWARRKGIAYGEHAPNGCASPV